MRSSFAAGAAGVAALLTLSDSDVEVESARVNAAGAPERATEWRREEILNMGERNGDGFVQWTSMAATARCQWSQQTESASGG